MHKFRVHRVDNFVYRISGILSLYTTSDVKRNAQPICTRNISLFLIPAECVTVTD